MTTSQPKENNCVSISMRRVLDLMQENKALAAGIFIFFFIALVFNSAYRGDQTFVDLARSFLNGRLDLVSGTTYDTAAWHGKQYWPFGPLPAILLMPGVYLFSLAGSFFYQGYLQFLFGCTIAVLCFQIARRIGFIERDALYAAIAFCSGSMFLGVFLVPNYSFFSHVVVVFFLFLAIREFLNKKRRFLLGVCVGLAAATRPTALFGIIFFIGEILFSKKTTKEKCVSLIQILFPIGVILCLLAWYNYSRFGSIFETGYALQSLTIPELITARTQGLLSGVHIPKNIYYSLFALPQIVTSYAGPTFPFLRPNPWGMSIFITSPYLLLLFRFRYRDTVSKVLLISILITAVPIFLYYGIGFWQFGYRYALDFFPFLLFLFLREYRERWGCLSACMRKIIIVSSFVNFFLFFSLLFHGA